MRVKMPLAEPIDIDIPVSKRSRPAVPQRKADRRFSELGMRQRQKSEKQHLGSRALGHYIDLVKLDVVCWLSLLPSMRVSSFQDKHMMLLR